MSVKSQTLTYETHNLSIRPCRIHMILIGNYHQTFLHYRPRFCTLKIRIENALKTQAIRSVYSIPNSQSPLITDNVLHCSVTHFTCLPIKLADLSTQINVYHCVSKQFCIQMHSPSI